MAARYIAGPARSPGWFDTQTGTYFPDNPALPEWKAFDAWKRAGNTPDPFPTPGPSQSRGQRIDQTLDTGLSALPSANSVPALRAILAQVLTDLKTNLGSASEA